MWGSHCGPDTRPGMRRALRLAEEGSQLSSLCVVPASQPGGCFWDRVAIGWDKRADRDTGLLSSRRPAKLVLMAPGRLQTSAGEMQGPAWLSQNCTASPLPTPARAAQSPGLRSRFPSAGGGCSHTARRVHRQREVRGHFYNRSTTTGGLAYPPSLSCPFTPDSSHTAAPLSQTQDPF